MELSGGNLSVEELLAVMQRSGFFPQTKEVQGRVQERNNAKKWWENIYFDLVGIY